MHIDDQPKKTTLFQGDKHIEMENAFVHSAEEVAKVFDVDIKSGLTASQVQEGLNKYGPNSLPEDEPTSLLSLVLAQFEDQLTLILLASAVVSFALAFFDEELSWSAFVDPAVILSILILNAIVGVQQERSAEDSIAALGEYSSGEAKVVRNGSIFKVKHADLVPGDLVELSVGDSVPADCRLVSITSKAFLVDQSILTGESQSVVKTLESIKDAQAVKQDQGCMVFSGTTVAYGHARAVVVLTGSQTAIGDIHQSIVSQISMPTPLKEKLDAFGEMLAKVITVICILVWLINIGNFSDPVHKGWFKGAIYYFKIAIALAVAAIPEGLAVVITTCLALGTKKMAARNAIVRNLPSVETLGSTTVICSDKTGTLTTNQMCVCHVVHLNNVGVPVELNVDGSDFTPDGSVTLNDKKVSASNSTILEAIARLSALCNTSQLTFENNSYGFVGESTEAALRVLVEKLGSPVSIDSIEKTKHSVTPINSLYEHQSTTVSTFEFSRDRKSMSVAVQDSTGSVLLVKGALENLLARSTSFISENGANGLTESPLTPEISAGLLEIAESYGKLGLRLIAFAQRSISADEENLIQSGSTPEEFIKIESNLSIIGFAAMRDPPRPEVAQSIATCHRAGIRVIVVTGDSKPTAEAICRNIGIFGPTQNTEGLSFTGRDLESLSEEELGEIVKNARLFTRVEPRHKALIVEQLQKQREVVAVTGDGVNDAPALKRADIGIAMGGGTDVARLAADMVLADNNFSTIEAAIEEGRTIYNNSKQFIRYLISSNIGEVVSIFLTVLLGLPEALAPVQLLWVNLVTDGLPATALGFNPSDNEVMMRPPRSRDEPIVGKWLFFRYMVVGTYVGVATVFGYIWWFVFYAEGPQISFYQLSHFHSCSTQFNEIGCEMFSNSMAQHGSTMSLSILVIIEMLNAANNLSESDSLLTFPIWKNVYLIYAILLSVALHVAILYVPWLQTLFETVPLNQSEWLAVLYISAPVVLIDELCKIVERNVVIPYREKNVQATVTELKKNE